MAQFNNEQLSLDIGAVMSTKSGRRAVAYVLSLCGMDISSFNGQSNHTIYREGRRAVGLDLKNKLTEVAPESYLAMIKEEHNDV